MILERIEKTNKGTFGILTVNDFLRFYTVERPWDNNNPFTSCVEPGVYSLVPHKSHKYGNVLALVNENLGVTHWQENHSKRYAILIHPANFPHDVQGCIGLGDSYIADKNMVTNSRQAIIDFYEAVDPNMVHELEII